MNDVVVIGGGAAGLAAAVAAAQQGAAVTVLEAQERVGTKILATGNGRCNLTNTQIGTRSASGAVAGADAYNCPAFVTAVLKRYDAQRIRLFFEQLGLATCEEREGRVYPLSNTASSVVDVLRAACERLNVRTMCGFAVDVITQEDGRFHIASPDGGRGSASRIIVACGGTSTLLRHCGHTLAPYQPVLCPLATQTDILRGLSGVRVRARVSAFDASSVNKTPFAREEGEVLFRAYGLSGIVIFNLSRLVQPGHSLSLDFLPDMENTEVEELLHQRLQVLLADLGRWDGLSALNTSTTHDTPAAASNNTRAAALRGRFAPKERSGAASSDASAPDANMPTYADLMCGLFHPRVNIAVLRAAHLKPSQRVVDDALPTLAAACKDLRVQVKGPTDVKHAQVTRGGALVDEFDSATLQSRKVPGLYAAGEVLNVDGRCGGYNLHWAWASGIIAGRSAARS